MNIKKGDHVHIVSGKNRGKTGEVISVFPDAGRISVAGINMYKKRSRPKKQGQKGETVVVIPDEKITSVLGTSQLAAVVRLPNWLGWWRVFFK